MPPDPHAYTCHGLTPGIHHSLAALGLFAIWIKRRKSWYLREGCAQIGYAKSVREIQAIVGTIVAKKNALDSMVVSHGWWDCFRQRHPHLTLRSGEGLAYCRAVSTNRVVINKYFDLLEQVLDSNNLTKKPHLIFNVDETGM